MSNETISLSFSAETSRTVGNMDVKGLGLFNDFSSLSGRNRVSDFSSKVLVREDKGF